MNLEIEPIQQLDPEDRISVLKDSISSLETFRHEIDEEIAEKKAELRLLEPASDVIDLVFRESDEVAMVTFPNGKNLHFLKGNARGNSLEIVRRTALASQTTEDLYDLLDKDQKVPSAIISSLVSALNKRLSSVDYKINVIGKNDKGRKLYKLQEVSEHKCTPRQELMLDHFKNGGMIPGFELVKRLGGDMFDQGQISQLKVEIKELNRTLRRKGEEIINTGTSQDPLWEKTDFDVNTLESRERYEEILAAHLQVQEEEQTVITLDKDEEITLPDVELTEFDKEKQKEERLRKLAQQIPNLENDIKRAFEKLGRTNAREFNPIQAATVLNIPRSDFNKLLDEGYIKPQQKEGKNDYHPWLTYEEAIIAYVCVKNYDKVDKNAVSLMQELIERAIDELRAEH